MPTMLAPHQRYTTVSIPASYPPLKVSDFILAVICIDMLLHDNIDGVATTQDVIELRFISPTYRKTLHLFYELDSDNNVTFKDLLGISTVMLEDLN